MAQLKDTSVTGDLTITNDGTTINVKDEIDALNSKFIDISNLKQYQITYANDVDVDIVYDGYICERVNYSSTSGYSIFTIKDSDGNTVFSHQMACGANSTYSYDGCFLPVKAGWKFNITGQNLSATQIKFAH